MPAVVYLLALAVFAQGTSEFMLAGLVPQIAAGLSVSVPAAGSLTSAYAVGMVVGAPAMALLSRRWSPRAALLAFLTAFLLAHVVAATTGSYAVLVGTRIVAALANAGFLAVALSTTAAIAGPRATGRATSVLLGGVTVACIAGVPGGALLGQSWGWRAPFWAVALACVPALLAIVRAVPRATADHRSTEPTASARAELAVLRRPRLRLVLLLGALVNGATFGAFTYLAPVVTDVAGLGKGWVPPVLALFGLGAFAGVTAGGRLADRPGLRRTLGLLTTALLAGWVLLALLAHVAAVVVAGAGVQGTLSFAVGSALIARSLAAAGDRAPRLAGAYATAAMNMGAAAGPWLAGAAIAAGAGYRSPLWVSAALVAAAAVVTLSSLILEKARNRSDIPGGDSAVTPRSTRG
ncbi:Cmx/CmrA family chloramphenicol efflux MFS transporter [Jiangella mangrovi]|uniref:DHA1 family chloramphenicol resistance protein-like MFS transporter n=1 Tax=Jiangella mangrovi TaxID=1524084 RepID=A0A7W9GUM4_9ACTN|nr:Cmx/CmrA family chloramphenicol efflux MFS transporter [Jiangella mangrovi]MBB5790006.1 DHA1 family chloramphenicol resistance protein-like MFS transporter [Jiangella mangrovi]